MKRVIAVLSIPLLLAACGSSSTSGKQQALASSTTTSSSVNPKIPAGYVDAGSGVWLDWADKSTYECKSYHDSCWGMNVYTEYGCNTLYLEISILKNGVIVDRDNELLSNLQPDDLAQVVFGQIGHDTPLQAKFAEASCI